MKLKSYLFYCFAFFYLNTLLSLKVEAQIVVTQRTAQTLVENYLVGNGVEVSNVTFVGDSAQIASFTGGNTTNLNIPAGVVMTSGNANLNVVGPNTGTGTTSPEDVNTNDPDLNTILEEQGVSNPSTHTLCIIEFDFIPAGDTLSFSYVFGSEEYNEWVCSHFFDAFGFFLSGPGINGTYSNNSVNLAIVPGTDLPVGINTINNGTNGSSSFDSLCSVAGLSNTQYYVDNEVGTTLQPDGFTTVLTAAATVQCGQLYHIKLIVANGGDPGLDSYVFLQAGSFSSNIPDLFTANLLPDSSTVEGCTSAPLIFTRNNDDDELIISVAYTGTAVNGVDYNLLPDTLIFAVGTDTLQYTLTPLTDALTEGFETVTISFNVLNDCGDTIFVTRTLKIRDPYQLTLNSAQVVNLTCPDTDFSIGVGVSGGYAPYNYQWSNNSTDSLLVTPISETTTFTVEISDSLDCFFTTYLDTILVTLNYDTLISEPQIITLCEGFTDTIGTIANRGLPPYDISWGSFGQTDSIIITGTDTIKYAYTVTDQCNISISDTVTVNVAHYEPVIVIANDTTICKNTPALLSGTAQGGNGIYTYVWTGPGDITTINDSLSGASPLTETDYLLTVTDGCQENGSDTTTVTVENCELQVGNAFSPNGDGMNDYFLIANIEAFPNNIVYLFNRWGNKVLEQPSYANNWSGDDIASGTYFYVVDPGDGTEILKGYVTVFKD